MRQLAFLAVVLVAAGTALAQDWEGDLVGAEATGDLHGMVGVTWDSQYIWRGFEVFGSTSATHILGDVNLFDTGFGISAAGHYANGSGYVDGTRWDYTLYYQNGLFAGERFATNYRVGWVLYDYTDTPSEWADLQEGHLVLSWPNILPVPGLCPSYVAAKTWPSEGGSSLGDSASGWFHIFMLDYGFTVPGVLPDMPEHLIKLHGEVVYNDGVNPYGRNMDNEVSHAVLGISTDLEFGENITVTPAVYYQMTMETMLESYNNGSDELWASVGLTYQF